MRNSKKYINHVGATISHNNFEKRIASNSIREKFPSEEKPFGKELYERGKKAYYDEYFYGINLESQIIEKIGTFDNPINTVSFQKGYERGKIIVSFNDEKMLPEEYQSINKKHR